MQSILTLSAALKKRILPTREPAGKMTVHIKNRDDNRKSFQDHEDYHFSVTAD